MKKVPQSYIEVMNRMGYGHYGAIKEITLDKDVLGVECMAIRYVNGSCASIPFFEGKYGRD